MIDVMGMVRAWVPGSEAELAVIRSLLDAEGVLYFVQGDTHINTANKMMISHPELGKAVWVEDVSVSYVHELVKRLESTDLTQTDVAGDALTSGWRRLKKFLGLFLLGIG